MTRVLGVDLGSRRIGVALSDPGRVLASPLCTIERHGRPEDDHRRLKEISDEWEAEVVVVGLPRSLDGTLGPAARGVLAEVEALREAIGRTVETYDERFTTVTADQRLAEQGIGGRRRRRRVDQAAAAVLLQAWLDARAPGTTGRGDDV